MGFLYSKSEVRMRFKSDKKHPKHVQSIIRKRRKAKYIRTINENYAKRLSERVAPVEKPDLDDPDSLRLWLSKRLT